MGVQRLTTRAVGAFLFAALGFAAAAPSQLRLPYDPRTGVVKIVCSGEAGAEDIGAGIAVGFDPEERLVMIITAAHVIRGAETVEVVFFNKRWVKYPATVFDIVLHDLDIAMVTVQLDKSVSLLEKIPRFTIGDTRGMSAGADVLAIGHPLNSEWQVAQNQVLRPRDPDDRRKMTFTKLGVDRGNSGGPLLDAKGAVIGIVSKKAPNHAVAVRIEAVVEILREDWQVPLTFLGNEAPSDGVAGVAGVAADPSAPQPTAPQPAAPQPAAPQPAAPQPAAPQPAAPQPVAPQPGATPPSVSDAPTQGAAPTPPGPTPGVDTVEGGTEAVADTGPTEAGAGVVWDGTSFNYLPKAVADAVVTAEDSAVQIDVLANDTDQDEDPLQVIAVDAKSASGGTVGRDGSKIMYIPPPDFTGADSFKYSITDGREGTATTTVTIAISPVNDPPVLTEMELEVREGETLATTVAAEDPDGDELTYTVTGLPEEAKLDPQTGELTYTPNFAASKPGTETLHPFELTADDGQGGVTKQASRLKILDVPGGLDPGAGVGVELPAGPEGDRAISLEFERVISRGVASLAWAPAGEAAPAAGYRLSGNSYLDVASTAQVDGTTRICIEYQGMPVDAEQLTLQQWADGQGWREITEPSGATDGTICGAMDRVGRVALLERLAVSVPSTVVARGKSFQAQLPVADAASITGATWTWGDSTTSPGAVGTYSVDGEHAYAATGIYLASVELVGSAGTVGSALLGPIAVYDSAAGSVRGTGSFASPPGASARGTVKFKFNSEYKTGTRPTGKATINVDGPDIKFKGETQSWLVISDGFVAVQGEGKLNNAGNYEYLITASAGGEKIRARIVEPASGKVIYDSQPGDPIDAAPQASLGNGSIKVGR